MATRFWGGGEDEIEDGARGDRQPATVFRRTTNHHHHHALHFSPLSSLLTPPTNTILTSVHPNSTTKVTIATTPPSAISTSGELFSSGELHQHRPSKLHYPHPHLSPIATPLIPPARSQPPKLVNPSPPLTPPRRPRSYSRRNPTSSSPVATRRCHLREPSYLAFPSSTTIRSETPSPSRPLLLHLRLLSGDDGHLPLSKSTAAASSDPPPPAVPTKIRPVGSIPQTTNISSLPAPITDGPSWLSIKVGAPSAVRSAWLPLQARWSDRVEPRD